jgi:hypothetical protein
MGLHRKEKSVFRPMNANETQDVSNNGDKLWIARLEETNVTLLKKNQQLEKENLYLMEKLRGETTGLGR